MEKILIVEDNPDMQKILSHILEEKGYQTKSISDGKMAIKEASEGIPDVVLLDIKLPGMNGMDVLREMKKLDRNLGVIIITAHGDIKGAVEAMKLGAFDYITKPFDIDELLLIIQRAMHTRYLSREVESLRKRLGEKLPQTIIGESPQLKNILKQVKMVAPTDLTVVIQGESGTGKELIARLIHQQSKRRNKPFVAIDCGAIPETLMESHLFGYEKGAFTGATGTKEGFFEQANGGTLFLDEITNLPLESQKKFLRVIEQKKFKPVGSKESKDVDVRLITASNISLTDTVRRGEFREDLFHRLTEFHIFLPPLKNRDGDCAILAKHFTNKYSNEFEKKIKGISEKALTVINDYHWPGNIREMINVIRRAVLLCESEYIRPEDLSIMDLEKSLEENSNENKSFLNLTKERTFDDILSDVEFAVIKKALEKTGGNKTKAARLLDINRKTFYRKLKKLGL